MMTQPNPSNPSDPSAEIVLGMKTFVVSTAQSAVRGTIHCTLLFGDLPKKVAFSSRRHVNPAHQGEVEAGLRVLAQSVAERLQWPDGQNKRERITLTNGIPSEDVECWQIPADTKLDERQLDFFLQNLHQCLGMPDQNVVLSLALVKWVGAMVSSRAR
jgi:hypothetical protein